jgi:leucine dehydrogenase
MKELIQNWSGESVVTRFDRDTQTWVFIALHDLTLGPAMGGVRMRSYPTPADGLRDAMRLAEGMTYKWAGIGFDLGGGKSVLAVPGLVTGAARQGLFRRFGRLLALLRGAYSCGPDLGTTPADMVQIGQETEHVHGYDRVSGGAIDPGPFTALGVFVGMRAALKQAFGSEELRGRTVLIQGVGDVGDPLARLLADAGATLVLSDVDQARAGRLASELSGTSVAAEAVYTTPCDVYAPCAVGATLNEHTIPQLTCRIVAGSANNQLAESADADRLHRSNILYAPDYIINAGGATALPLLGQGSAEEAVRQRIRGLERALGEIFGEAAADGMSPHHVAQRRVDRVLASRRRPS